MTKWSGIGFGFIHTKGEILDKSGTVERSGVALNWTSEGYVSGIAYAKKNVSSEVPDFEINVDISTNGVLRLYTTEAIMSSGKYYFDIEFTMSSGKTKTWCNNDMSPYIAEIKQDVTRVTT
jgi:hypothetical protein